MTKFKSMFFNRAASLNFVCISSTEPNLAPLTRKSGLNTVLGVVSCPMGVIGSVVGAESADRVGVVGRDFFFEWRL